MYFLRIPYIHTEIVNFSSHIYFINSNFCNWFLLRITFRSGSEMCMYVLLPALPKCRCTKTGTRAWRFDYLPGRFTPSQCPISAFDGKVYTHFIRSNYIIIIMSLIYIAKNKSPPFQFRSLLRWLSETQYNYRTVWRRVQNILFLCIYNFFFF